MLSDLLTRLWEMLGSLVANIGPLPLMIGAALMYFSDHPIAVKIKAWIMERLSGNKSPEQSKPNPSSSGEVDIDYVLGVLNQITGWATKSGNKELLKKATDLYQDLQTLGVKKVG